MTGGGNQVIDSVQITNASGPCILIQGGASNVIVKNSKLGPCGSHGIKIDSSNHIEIANTHIFNTNGNNIQAYQSDSINIHNNILEYGSSGVYAEKCTLVQVDYNSFYNIQGPYPRGQYVQFNHVTGGGNRITCNIGDNIFGQSDPQDNINLFDTWGLAEDPILVIGNKIRGGGPSTSGGGIILGDGGGAYQIAQDNILVKPGQYGVAVAGGHDMQILQNQVYAPTQPWNNVGIFVWLNGSATSCSNITVSNNKVNYTNKNGEYNAWWNGGNCGTINGLSTNNFNAALDENVYYQDVPYCSEGTLNPRPFAPQNLRTVR